MPYGKAAPVKPKKPRTPNLGTGLAGKAQNALRGREAQLQAQLDAAIKKMHR